MECFYTIDSLAGAIEEKLANGDADAVFYRDIIDENRDMMAFLRVLEAANPCGQKYFLHKRAMIISYEASWALLSVGRKPVLHLRYSMIGLPVSLSNPGYFTAKRDRETRAAIAGIVKQIADSQKGLSVVLNADVPVCGERMAPPTYVFCSNFKSFEEYMASLRSSYRRKFRAVLEKGKHIQYARLGKGGFTKAHYELYLRVCDRAAMVFRVLPFDYFNCCADDIFEARDREGGLLAFVQLRDIDGVLYFVYTGFGPCEAGNSNSPDQVGLYYNLLLFIIRHGIENGYKKIVFGQTSDESKSKIGCREQRKYMYMTSSNILVKAFFKLFPRFYSFKPHQADYHVFK